jgi:hypothetical protein
MNSLQIYAYTENTLNGKLSTKIVYISVNDNMNVTVFYATVPLKHFLNPHPPANTSSIIACRQLSDSLILLLFVARPLQNPQSRA